MRPSKAACFPGWFLTCCGAALLCCACATIQEPPRLGGDRDEHGCIGSAGYLWCEEKQKCRRPWEESCLVAEKIVAPYFCENLGPLEVEYYTDGRAILKLQNRQYVLNRTISASGARYEGEKIIFWEKGGRARLVIDGREHLCNSRP